MKTLTKVKIINWHYFWNETIEIKPLSFLTGENGAGKSTLIDAIQLVLLGDTSGRYFNKAAAEKSARTLKSYLKGEIGDTLDGGFKYLRNGRFTSYIALEFFNDLANTYFTMGVVFDVFDDGSEEHRFFCLEDKIPENEFIQNEIPMEYKNLSKFFGESYPDKYIFFDSNKSYKEFLKKRFGGLKDKYFSLLKKATSFSPIMDISTFITEYICDPQADIQLDVLQDNILEYKRLETEAKVIEERVNKLEEISKNYATYKQNQENFIISQYIIEKCELEQSKNKLQVFKDNILRNQERINQIDLEIADFNENLAALDRKKVALIQDKASNSTNRLTEGLYDQKKDIEEQVKAINENTFLITSNINEYLSAYIKVSNDLLSNLSSFNLDNIEEDKVEEIIALVRESKNINEYCLTFKKDKLSDISTISKDDLLALRNEMSKFKARVSSLSITIQRTIYNINRKIGSLKDEQISMKQGVKPYNPRLVDIKKQLEQELSNKYNKPIEVSIYADLIDIKDLSWSNAIESYLYNQKFNLFVAPKYYEEAYSILRRLLTENNFYQTALVDDSRIIERDYSCEPGSLAEEVITDHEGARAYTNFLIGRLYKSKNVNEARNYGNGITKECDLYRNFSLARINPRLYQESFIGRAISERFMDEKSNQLQANIINLNLYKKIEAMVIDANNIELLSTIEIENMSNLIGKCSGLEGLNKTLEYVESQLKEQDTTLLDSLDRRIKEVENDISSIQDDKEKSLMEKGNLLNEIENIKNEKIKGEEEAIRTREESLKSKYDPFLVNDQALPIYQKQVEEGHSNMEILQTFNVSLSKLQYLVTSIFNALVKARRDYVSIYHLSMNPEAQDNKEFDHELTDFKEVQLPSYREKIEDSYHKATQQFKDDFIFKLRGAIEDVEDQISSLNMALEQSVFGDELYRFTVKPSTVYRRYYDMFKDDLILKGGDDETEFINKYKDVMDDLFRQIVDVGDGNQTKSNELLANIEKFTDYRSYLEFDLISKNVSTGDEQRLSKMLNKKSGGETQTPFYIAMLASFSQLYHANESGELGNSIRIIIFDEAFSKMDQTRLKESINLLAKFKLQVIISAPSDKIRIISKLTDETIVALKETNRSCVKVFAKGEDIKIK